MQRLLGSFIRPPFPLFLVLRPEQSTPSKSSEAAKPKKSSTQVGLRHERSFVENLLLGKTNLEFCINMFQHISIGFCKLNFPSRHR